MTDFLPSDYTDNTVLPQVFGNAGVGGRVLQMQYEGGEGQLLLDSAASSTTQVRVRSYGSSSLEAEDLSFAYKPVDNSDASYIGLNIVGEPELQTDGSYLVTVDIPPLLNKIDGHLIATSSDGASTDGLPITQYPYPSIPQELLNDGASRQIIFDYENLLDVLAPPGSRSVSGTVQSNFAKKGLNALENKDDIKRNEAVQGAVQQAVSRIRGLSEVIGINHIADEVLKLQLWATSTSFADLTSIDIIDVALDSANIVEYVAGITQDLTKLTKILEEYGINLKGTTAVQNSNIVNHSAQAFRHTSNSVYDIESPTTLLNTEYLVQQSSKATFRQTGVDQLSCFDSWQRAEDTITRQSKTQYNYATEKIVDGAPAQVGTYTTGSDSYQQDYTMQTGAGPFETSYTLKSFSNIDFFSETGDFLVRVMKNIIHSSYEFMVKAKQSIFLQSGGDVAIEAQNGDLHLINKTGRIVIDANNVVFRTTNPIEYLLGEGPAYPYRMQGYGPPVSRPEMQLYPYLYLIDAREPKEIELDYSKILYTVYGEYLTIPIIGPVITPTPLLPYPKAPLGPTVPQPNNGVVSSPVYPST